MTKNTVYDVTISEILLLIRRNWKFIVITTIIFILLCGGFKLATINQGESGTLQNEDYARDAEVYELFQNAQKNIPPSFKEEWKRVYWDRVDNPIFSIDPFNCEYEQIVIRFKDGNNNHDWTVSNWISQADNQELFGSEADSLSDFKSTIVTLGESTESGETAVQLLSVQNYDTDSAARYLEKHFRKCAEKDGITIDGISRVTAKGYNDSVREYQKRNRDDFSSIYSALENSGNIERHIPNPGDLQEDKSSRIKGLIKYCLIGLILGIIAGSVLVFMRAARKREILSARQVEDTYKLELLSDCSSNSNTSLDVLNANLDIMAGEHSSIAVVTSDSIKGMADIIERWSEISNRTFFLCTDIFDNPAMIESLKKTKGIVLGIKLGDSKLEQVQSVLLRAEKLGQHVLGFVLI